MQQKTTKLMPMVRLGNRTYRVLGNSHVKLTPTGRVNRHPTYDNNITSQ
ncbi:MAG: hypothetical protein OXU23_04935 [Candidatus Poribacteria bacterium]|nr:hypothetical protein [Candidatus Poribacteria bacterium]